MCLSFFVSIAFSAWHMVLLKFTWEGLLRWTWLNCSSSSIWHNPNFREIFPFSFFFTLKICDYIIMCVLLDHIRSQPYHTPLQIYLHRLSSWIDVLKQNNHSLAANSLGRFPLNITRLAFWWLIYCPFQSSILHLIIYGIIGIRARRDTELI